MKTTNLSLIHQPHNLKYILEERTHTMRAVEKKRHVAPVPMLVVLSSCQGFTRNPPPHARLHYCLHNWKWAQCMWDYIDRGMGGGLEEGVGNQGPGKEMIFRDERRREVPGKLWREASAPLRYISNCLTFNWQGSYSGLSLNSLFLQRDHGGRRQQTYVHLAI